MREGQNGIFTSEDAELEVQRLFRKSETIDWEPTKTHKFHLLIPPTVYPPREDTELFARRLTSIGPGRGRKLLEIGCGSGALTILASSLGWKVSACDINPYAVAAARGNLQTNLQKGTVKEGGVGPDRFPFQEQFDLIIWNLPYIPASEINSVLGPMEEAGLIDTDDKGLTVRLLKCIEQNNLLTTTGRILILSRANSIHQQSEFAVRKWDELEFEDGEKLEINCLWKPYAKSTKKYVERTGSTNDDLLAADGNVGTHISASWQEHGRGRRDRIWQSIEGCYAGSWIVALGKDINPGLLQLSGGLAVMKTIDDSRLKLKWPNDILFDNRKLCGILVEGKTISNITKVVLGIGINLKSTNEIQDFEIASLDEIIEISHSNFDSKLHCNLASLLEHGENLPPIDFEAIRREVLQYMIQYGNPIHGGITYDSFSLNERGELLLGNNTVDDGEDIEWV